MIATVVQYEPGDRHDMQIARALKLFTGLSLATLLPFSALAAPLQTAPATLVAAERSASQRGRAKPEAPQKQRATNADLKELLNRVRDTDSFRSHHLNGIHRRPSPIAGVVLARHRQ